jgi:hypothetical protein
VLGENGGQGAQAGCAGQLACLIAQRDALVAFEHQQHGSLDADLLGVGRRQAVEGVFGVGTERAESARQMRLAVLQASEVGGEAGEVAAGGAVVAFGLVFQRAGLALDQARAEEFLWLRGGSWHAFSGDGETPVSCDVVCIAEYACNLLLNAGTLLLLSV